MCFGNSATKPYVAARACEWLADGFSRRVFCLPWILVSRKYCEKASWSLLQIPHQLSFQPQERNAGRCRLQKLRKSSKTLANTPHRPLRCFAAADAQFWCSSLSKSLNIKLQKIINLKGGCLWSQLQVWRSEQDLPSETVQVTFLRSRTLLKKLVWNHEFCRFNERQLVNTEIFWNSIPLNSFSTLLWKKNVVKVQKLILPASIWSPHHGIAQAECDRHDPEAKLHLHQHAMRGPTSPLRSPPSRLWQLWPENFTFYQLHFQRLDSQKSGWMIHRFIVSDS